jgi:hypothetical protein
MVDCYTRTGQVEEEGEYARAAGELHVLGAVVVVHAVVLALLVPQHLIPESRRSRKISLMLKSTASTM